MSQSRRSFEKQVVGPDRIGTGRPQSLRLSEELRVITYLPMACAVVEQTKQVLRWLVSSFALSVPLVDVVSEVHLLAISACSTPA